MKPNPATIYLDYCSTTPIDPVVADAIHECHLRQDPNPASQHRGGQLARRELEQRKLAMLTLLGARTEGRQTDRLVVTSGGTESNHLAVCGLWRAGRPQLLVSAVEHPGVHGAAELAGLRGARVRKVPVDREGRIDLSILEQWLAEVPTSLVSLMLVNHETGVIQPVAEAARIAHAAGALLHTDAVQAIGHLAVDFSALGADALTLAAHKFHGPRGVGGLILRHGVEPTPLMLGGSQQTGTRPGTEDLAGVVGMQTALARVLQGWPESSRRIAALRDRFESLLRESIAGPLWINGGGAPRSGHVSNLAFPGLNRQALLMAADLAGLAFSTGSACASGSSEPSPVLVAMGLEDQRIEGSVRVSFGLPTGAAEVEEAVKRLASVISGFSRGQ